MYQLRTSDWHAYSQGDLLDLLVAFDTEAISSHARDMKSTGRLIFDADRTPKTYSSLPKCSFGVPFTSLAKNQLAFPKGRNMIIAGYVAGHVGVSKATLEEVVTEKLGSRGQEIVQRNVAAVELGFGLAPKELKNMDFLRAIPNKIVVTGNQAIVLGAIAAGCRFYAGYPITPASDILEGMANFLPSFGGRVFQGEDEMASVGAAIGASFAGTKAMTATSGPGFSLMTEMIGMASMAEVPVVIVDAQRGGPSTGLPTKTEQSDLDHALYGGHGDVPRIVIAPGNVEDCLYQTVRAFNLAERYQLPVLLLTDQSLAQLTEGMPIPDLDSLSIMDRERAQIAGGVFQRYAVTHDGISPMSIPGQANGEYVAESVEHDATGRPSYRPQIHSEMTAKRFRKLETAAIELANDPLNVKELLDPKAKVGVIGWGSTQGAIHDAVLRARKKSIRVRWLQCKLLNPLPKKQISTFLEGLKKVLVPELNYSAQFANLLRMNFMIEPILFNKSEGLPFRADEICRKIEEVA